MAVVEDGILRVANFATTESKHQALYSRIRKIKLSNYTKEKLLENLGNLTLIIRKLLCKKLMILLPSGGGAGHSDGPPTKLLSHAPNITAILPITELV